MTVGEIVDQIIARIDIDLFNLYGEPGILQIVNRAYKNVNREKLCLEKSYEVTESEAGTVLPTDWIRAFAHDQDELFYVDYREFDPKVDHTYTIVNNTIYFGSPDSSNTVTFYYYSSGYKLVRSDAGIKEVTIPEWREESLHSYLYYAVLVELGIANKFEIAEYVRIKSELNTLNYDKDDINPTRTVPLVGSPKNKYIDDYEKP